MTSINVLKKNEIPEIFWMIFVAVLIVYGVMAATPCCFTV